MAAMYYFIFNSRNQAVYMESMLKQKGYKLELRPTPSKLGKGCNSSLVVEGELSEIESVRNQILSYRMSIKGIYKAIQKGYFTHYAKVF